MRAMILGAALAAMAVGLAGCDDGATTVQDGSAAGPVTVRKGPFGAYYKDMTLAFGDGIKVPLTLVADTEGELDRSLPLVVPFFQACRILGENPSGIEKVTVYWETVPVRNGSIDPALISRGWRNAVRLVVYFAPTKDWPDDLRDAFGDLFLPEKPLPINWYIGPDAIFSFDSYGQAACGWDPRAKRFGHGMVETTLRYMYLNENVSDNLSSHF